MGAFDRNVDDIRLGAGGEFNELLLNDFIPGQASVVLGFDLNVRVLLLKAGNRLLTADLLLFGSGAAELDSRICSSATEGAKTATTTSMDNNSAISFFMVSLSFCFLSLLECKYTFFCETFYPFTSAIHVYFHFSYHDFTTSMSNCQYLSKYYPRYFYISPIFPF